MAPCRLLLLSLAPVAAAALPAVLERLAPAPILAEQDANESSVSDFVLNPYKACTDGHTPIQPIYVYMWRVTLASTVTCLLAMLPCWMGGSETPLEVEFVALVWMSCNVFMALYIELEVIFWWQTPECLSDIDWRGWIMLRAWRLMNMPQYAILCSVIIHNLMVRWFGYACIDMRVSWGFRKVCKVNHVRSLWWPIDTHVLGVLRKPTALSQRGPSRYIPRRPNTTVPHFGPQPMLSVFGRTEAGRVIDIRGDTGGSDIPGATFIRGGTTTSGRVETMATDDGMLRFQSAQTTGRSASEESSVVSPPGLSPAVSPKCVALPSGDVAGGPKGASTYGATEDSGIGLPKDLTGLAGDDEQQEGSKLSRGGKVWRGVRYVAWALIACNTALMVCFLIPVFGLRYNHFWALPQVILIPWAVVLNVVDPEWWVYVLLLFLDTVGPLLSVAMPCAAFIYGVTWVRGDRTKWTTDVVCHRQLNAFDVDGSGHLRLPDRWLSTDKKTLKFGKAESDYGINQFKMEWIGEDREKAMRDGGRLVWTQQKLKQKQTKATATKARGFIWSQDEDSGWRMIKSTTDAGQEMKLLLSPEEELQLEKVGVTSEWTWRKAGWEAFYEKWHEEFMSRRMKGLTSPTGTVHVLTEDERREKAEIEFRRTWEEQKDWQQIERFDTTASVYTHSYLILQAQTLYASLFVILCSEWVNYNIQLYFGDVKNVNDTRGVILSAFNARQTCPWEACASDDVWGGILEFLNFGSFIRLVLRSGISPVSCPV